MMFIKILLTVLVFQLETRQILTQVCYSQNDPHMKTFDGTYYEFHYDGPHFILYTDFKETRITAGYQPCTQYSNARCNCAVYVKKANTLAFVDFCKLSSYSSPASNRFYTVSKKNDTDDYPIRPVTCTPILPFDEDNQDVWNKIIPANQFFKCAQIGDGTFITYVLRTFDPRYPGESVKVKVNIGPLSMSSIFITPSANSYKKTGGLCGMWNNERNNDLYILDDKGNPNYSASVQEVKNFWSLEKIWNPILPKCPECYLKLDKKLYCPCDNFSMTEEFNNNNNNDVKNSFCDVLMPNCVEKNIEFPISPPIEENTSSSTTSAPGGSTKPPFSIQDAQEMCTEGIMNNPGLKPLIQAGIYDPSEAIHNCVEDLILTHNTEFIQLHIDTALIQALQNVLQNETYYVNGTITQEGLNLLIGLCPSGCSGNGQCEINQNCLNLNSSRDKPLECLSPVMCVCNQNFGGPNCAINLLNVPDFIFTKKCCNVRNYNCDVISGYGYPFPRKTKLFYKIMFTETNNVNTFDGSITGEATVVSDNEFKIELPLHQIWLHNSSYVDVSVGISYNGNKYKYQNLQFFDSKCRFCDGEVSNEEIEQGTCLIENACYNNGETEPNNEDNICDISNNLFEWTYIGYKSPECNANTHEWSEWYNLDDPSGDGDIEILTLKEDLNCNATAIEVFTIDDIPAVKVNQHYYQDMAYGFICMNNEQSNNQACLDYKIRQCCEKKIKPQNCIVEFGLDINPIIVKENAGIVKISINKLNADGCKINEDIRVDFHTEPFTATTANFANNANSVVFSKDDKKKEIEIKIIDNNLIEPFKFFKFILDNVSGNNSVIKNNEKIIYIQDDDYDKQGAITGQVFDLMKRSHAEISINIAIFNQIVADPYDICPGSGGLSSETKDMELFLEFLDSLYEIHTIEIHNPSKCNLKKMTAYMMDRYGTPINNDALESISIDEELFIDIKYPKNLLKLNEKKDGVEAVKLDFEETKDGNNPSSCELRVFGKKVNG